MNKENYIAYTLSQLVYSATNGSFNEELRIKLREMILDELGQDHESEIAEIIDQVFNNEVKEWDLTYNWAIQTLKFGQIELTDKYKQIYIDLISNVIDRYSSLNNKEAVIQRLKTDIQGLS